MVFPVSCVPCPVSSSRARRLSFFFFLSFIHGQAGSKPHFNGSFGMLSFGINMFQRLSRGRVVCTRQPPCSLLEEVTSYAALALLVLHDANRPRTTVPHSMDTPNRSLSASSTLSTGWFACFPCLQSRLRAARATRSHVAWPSRETCKVKSNS